MCSRGVEKQTINGIIITLLYVMDVMVDFHNAGNISVQIPITIGTTPQLGGQNAPMVQLTILLHMRLTATTFPPDS